MRFLCHTAHTPHLTIVTDFYHCRHIILILKFSFRISLRKNSHHMKNTVPFMPFSLFSVRYAAQLRQRSFWTPLPTGIQGTKTHRQDPKMGPQPARTRKRMRNGKRKIDRMARCERQKEKAGKKCRGGRTTEVSAHPPVSPAKQERGTSASVWVARRPFERGKDWGARMLFQQMR